MSKKEVSASAAGNISLGGEISVHRLARRNAPYRRRHLGTAKGSQRSHRGSPPRRGTRCQFHHTADSYGPHVNEELIAEALFPYPLAW